MIDIVQDTVEAFELPSGMCLTVRNSTPGSVATISLLSGAVTLPAVSTASGSATVGPFTVPCRVAVGARGGVSVEVTNAAATALVSADGISDALVAAYEAGMFALPAGTRLGTIAGVPTASILLDAGSGGTVTTARVTFAPPTDTIGAQRLLTPTAETYTLTMDSALDVTLGDLGGIALAMHAIGVSTDAVLTGESYVAESDYTLAEYIAGDARFEWLDSTPTRVRLTLQRGSSTRYATLSVVAEVSA